MKQLFVFLMFMAAFSISSTAQSAKTAATQKTTVNTFAEKVAFANKDIIKRVDEKTGTVSYVRKDVCKKSGKVTFTPVQYNDATGTFVDVTKDTGKEKVKAKRKGCCSSGRSCDRPRKSCGSKRKSCGSGKSCSGKKLNKKS